MARKDLRKERLSRGLGRSPIARWVARPVGGVIAAVFATMLFAATTAVPASAEVTAVDGGAFGVQVGVTLVGVDTTLVATPSVSLPPTGGGPLTSSLASVSLPGVLSTGVLNTSTQGGNLNSHAGFATSTASVVDVNVLANLVSADVVSSTCTSNGDGSTGSTTLTGANVAGFGNLVASPTPNTKISLAGVAEITLNEQTRTDTVGSISTITVTAIHVHLNGLLAGGDVYVARSRCQVTGPDVLTGEPPAGPSDPGTPTGPSDPGTPTGTPTNTPTATPTAPATPTAATPHFTG
jgi:hypothetical protein